MLNEELCEKVENVQTVLDGIMAVMLVFKKYVLRMICGWKWKRF